MDLMCLARNECIGFGFNWYVVVYYSVLFLKKKKKNPRCTPRLCATTIIIPRQFDKSAAAAQAKYILYGRTGWLNFMNTTLNYDNIGFPRPKTL